MPVRAVRARVFQLQFCQTLKTYGREGPMTDPLVSEFKLEYILKPGAFTGSCQSSAVILQREGMKLPSCHSMSGDPAPKAPAATWMARPLPSANRATSLTL